MEHEKGQQDMLDAMGFNSFGGTKQQAGAGVDKRGDDQAAGTNPTEFAPAGPTIATAVVEDFHDGPGSKLAAFAAEAFPQFKWSRNKARGEVKAGLIRVNGQQAGANQILRGSDTVTVHKVAKVQWRNGMWSATVQPAENLNSNKRAKLAAKAAAGSDGEFGVHLDENGKCNKRKRGISCGCPDCANLSAAEKKKIRNHKKREAKLRKLAATGGGQRNVGQPAVEKSQAGLSNLSESTIVADVMSETDDPVAAAKAAAAAAQSIIQSQTGSNVGTQGKSTCQADCNSAGTADSISESAKWLYLDATGSAQGPFTLGMMQSWFQAGYLPNTTLVWTHESSQQMIMNCPEISGTTYAKSSKTGKAREVRKADSLLSSDESELESESEEHELTASGITKKGTLTQGRRSKTKGKAHSAATFLAVPTKQQQQCRHKMEHTEIDTGLDSD